MVAWVSNYGNDLQDNLERNEVTIFDVDFAVGAAKEHLPYYFALAVAKLGDGSDVVLPEGGGESVARLEPDAAVAFAEGGNFGDGLTGELELARAVKAVVHDEADILKV